MKKNLIVLILGLVCSIFESKAQLTENLQTQIDTTKFELLISYSYDSYLLNKYTGDVWKGSFSYFKEIQRSDRDVVDTTRVNYKLYLKHDSASYCFLVNIHTGDTWYLDTKGFVKAITPKRQ